MDATVGNRIKLGQQSTEDYQVEFPKYEWESYLLLQKSNLPLSDFELVDELPQCSLCNNPKKRLIS